MSASGASAASAASPWRSTALRLTRVHLRMGLLALARAELETFAVRHELDEDALRDLAEVRWRTGDLAGGGEAATLLLDRGGDDPLALIVAAEAVAAAGRPGEARRLAGRALAAIEGPLEPWFAGMPRSLIWPPEPAPPGPAEDEAHGGPGARGSRWRAAVAEPGGGGVGERDEGPASTPAAEAFAGGRAALAAGHPAEAALRLGVALRLEPAFAESVLEALGDPASEPALALVEGDALRLLGRESEALAAFDRARREPPETAQGSPDGDLAEG